MRTNNFIPLFIFQSNILNNNQIFLSINENGLKEKKRGGEENIYNELRKQSA